MLTWLISTAAFPNGDCERTHRIFKNIPAGPDLAENGARWILQDDDGFMWIGSLGGLYRFDGSNYKLFSRPGLGQQICDALYVSGDTLYAGLSRHLLKLDQARNGMDSIASFDHQIRGIAVGPDKLPIVVCSDGLYRQQPNGEWGFSKHFKGLALQSIVVKNNTAYVGGTDTYHAWNLVTDELKLIESGRSVEQQTIVEPYAWVASNKGLYRVHLDTYEKQDLLPQLPDQRALDNPDFRGAQVINGKVYMCSDVAGIFVFDTEGQFCHQIAMNNTVGLTSDKVWQAIGDRDGNLWTASHQSGLHVSLKKWEGIRLVTESQNAANKSVKLGPITRVKHLSKDTVLLASDGQGLMWYNPKTEQIKHLQSGLSPTKVLDLQQDSSGRVWIPTWNEGAYFFDRKAQKIKRFDPSPWGFDGLPVHISGALADDFNNIWISTFYSGIFVFREDGTWRYIDHKEEGKEGANHVRRLTRDDEFGVYIKNEPQIHHYVVEPDTIKFFNTYTPGDPQAYLGISLGCSIDRKMVHFGSTQGLQSFDHQGQPMPPQWPEIEALSGFIRSLMDVPGGTMIVTNKGLGYLVRKDTTWINMDFEDIGFQPHFGALDYSEDLGISIAGKDQYMHIPKSFFDVRSTSAKVYIDDIKINYTQDIGFTGYKQAAISWPFTKDPVTVKLAMVDHDYDRFTTFKYRLNEHDKFLQLDLRTEFTLPQLDPGNHPLEIVATAGDGTTSTTKLLINVTPVFFQTWWFRLLATLTVIAIIWVIIRLWLNQTLKAKAELEAEIASRTEQIREQRNEIVRQHNMMQEGMDVGRYFQESLLPTLDELKKGFDDAGLLFEARDTLSGDFFWRHDIGHTTYIIVADCVGHGVSAALLTMIGINYLNGQRHKLEHYTLNEIGLKIAGMYSASFKGRDLRFGLDLTIVKYNHHMNWLYYTGASGKLAVKRASTGSIELLKTDAFSINAHTIGRHLDFTEKEIAINKGDEIYIYTDGCTNQIRRDKKAVTFSTNRLVSHLESDRSENLSEKMQTLNDRLNKWAEEEHQTDDRLMLAIRI